MVLEDKTNANKFHQRRKNILIGIPIKNFSKIKDYLDEKTYSTKRQSRSERHKLVPKQIYGMY